RKSSMKSSGFGWEASSAVELLAAVFLAADEFCANAEPVRTNATNIIVITRHFLWFTGSFLTATLKLGASAARHCQQRAFSSIHDSKRVTSCISQPVQVSNCRRGHYPLEPGFREGNLQEESSGTRCQVSLGM